MNNIADAMKRKILHAESTISEITDKIAELSEKRRDLLTELSVYNRLFDELSLKNENKAARVKKKGYNTSHGKNGMKIVEACKMVLDDAGRTLNRKIIAKKILNDLGWKTHSSDFVSTVQAAMANEGEAYGIKSKISQNGIKVYWTENNR